MRLVSLTIFAQLQLCLSGSPKADWKTLTDGLKSKDLANQVSAYNTMNKPKAKAAPVAMDKSAIKENLEDELQKKMAERELKMEEHHHSATLKKQVQAVMSADKQLKHQMEQKMREKEIQDKVRHDKTMKEKMEKATGYTHKTHKAAPSKHVEVKDEEPLGEIPKAPPRKPVQEIPKAPPRKQLRAPVVEEPEVSESEVSIPRMPPAPKPVAPKPEPAANVHVGTVPQVNDELPMPSWGPKQTDSDNGASARSIGGNPWNDVGGRRQHKQSDADTIQKQVEAQSQEEMKVGHLPKLPVSSRKKTHKQVVQESEELAAHFEDGNGVARFSAHRRFIAGAPAPGPAPGPAPWTEDPEWMVDGARGDKTRTAPIHPDVWRGLANIPQPEQGFHGRPIVHEDMETVTGDWGSEFGPKGPSSAYKVCKEHPKSYWCRTHLKELSAGEDFGGMPPAPAASSDDDDEEEDEPSAPAPSMKSDASHVFAGLIAIATVFFAM